jgi:hypothetical protein
MSSKGCHILRRGMIAYAPPVVVRAARSRRDATDDHRRTHVSGPTIGSCYRDHKGSPTSEIQGMEPCDATPATWMYRSRSLRSWSVRSRTTERSMASSADRWAYSLKPIDAGHSAMPFMVLPVMACRIILTARAREKHNRVWKRHSRVWKRHNRVWKKHNRARAQHAIIVAWTRRPRVPSRPSHAGAASSARSCALPITFRRGRACADSKKLSGS